MNSKKIIAAGLISMSLAFAFPMSSEAKQLRYEATYTYPDAIFRGKAFTFKVRTRPGFNATCTFRTQDGAQIIGTKTAKMTNGLATVRFALVWPLNIRDDGSPWAVITDCENSKAYSAGYAWITGYSN